ncbi:MAG: fibronectin type III domain-containing protein [Vicinamibacterales bacterium]
MRTSALRLLLALVLTFDGLAAAASAQDRLFAEVELGAIGRFGQAIGPGAPGRYLWTGGGRYAVSVAARTAYDIRTGQTVVLSATAFGAIVVPDPVRPRLFVTRTDGVDGLWSIDVSSGARTLVDPGPVATLSECVFAASSDELFCLDAPSITARTMFRVTPAGRQTVFSGWILAPIFVSGPPSHQFGWVVTPDGAFTYFRRCDAPLPFPDFCGQASIVRLDLRTLATLALASTATSEALQWDESNERLLMYTGTGIRVLTKDLVDLGMTTLDGQCHDVAISPHTGRLYLNVEYRYFWSWSTLTGFDAATYRLVAPSISRTSSASCTGLLVLTAPGPPRDVRATVSGSTVSLARTNIGGASGFILEAGVAPGRTDVTLYLGADPRVTIPNVPPGTYYLRIRGANEFGGGRASTELRVVVP